MNGRFYAMWWTAVVLVVSGITLSLSSTAFGQARARGWLNRQYDIIGNEETYQLIMETNTLIFVVFGSILFGSGILLALASMGLQLFAATPKRTTELDEPLTEAEIH